VKAKNTFTPKRFFVIEPGLREATGHPVQYALALQQYGSRRGLPVYVVAHKRIQRAVTRELGSPLPMLTRACFPVTRTGPWDFCNALVDLHRRYGLNQDDLILVTSSHINELRGTALFLKSGLLGACPPMLALNFHQLFPPSPESELMCKPNYQSHWLKRMKSAFASLPPKCPSISCWTTVSHELNRTLRKVSGRHIGLLPFLFSESSRDKRATINGTGLRSLSGLRIAFLGDGREEKGLLLFLQAIRAYIPVESNSSFVIQHINPRGYEGIESVKLLESVAALRNRRDIVFIRKPLLPDVFRGLLGLVDAVVLPYDPRHYDRRASMVFAQAAIHRKPTIVSEGTWMAEEIRKKHASGVIFRSIPGDPNSSARQLAKAVGKLNQHFGQYSCAAISRSEYPRALHTADNYIDAILRHMRRRGRS